MVSSAAFWYIYSLMKKVLRTLRSQLPSVILIVVIASLCFSVGEGLRLTPFPVSALIRAEEPNVLLDAKASHGISLYKYGPLDVPTQTQKRSKRQAVDFACPPSADARELLTDRCPSSEHESVHVYILSVSRPVGRAPPFVI